MLGTGDADFLTIVVEQLDLRAQALVLGLTATLRIDDHQRCQASHVVQLLSHGLALFDMLEADRTSVLGDNRTGMRVPRGQLSTGFDAVAIRHHQRRTIRHLVTLTLLTVFGRDQHFTRTGNDDLFATGVSHVAHQRRETHHTGALVFNLRGHGSTRCGTTHVEGPHGELGTRFANRLRSNHADGFAGIHQRATAQITAIALGAQTVTGVTGQRCANLDFVHTGLIDQITQIFGQHSARLDDRFLRLRMDHIGSGDATENTIAKRLDDFTTFDEGADDKTVLGAAIVLNDDQILRHIDQTTGQVTRVGGLKRGIGQTLTGTVRRDEVLKHVQTFTEVRVDRRFDDRAIRLGHQAAHTGQLFDLRCRTPGTGVGHHVDGIERLLLDGLAFGIDHVFLAQTIHHDLGNLVASTAPDIHDLVVTLANGYQTIGVLRFDLLDLFAGSVEDVCLLGRHLHIAGSERNTGTGGQLEAVLHQLVGEDHGFLQAAATERFVDQLGDFFLLQRLVDGLKGQALRQNLRQQCTPSGRGVPVGDFFPAFTRCLGLPLADTHRDLGVQIEFFQRNGALYFSHIGQNHAFALGIDALTGGVIQTQHDILRRHDNRLAVGRRQNVVRGQHQRAGFHLCFQRQRDVNSHLVTVKVGVEGGTDQRMQLDGFTFNQHRLKGLDAQTVQRRRTVQHDRMLANDFFEDIPDDRLFVFHHLLGLLDGR